MGLISRVSSRTYRLGSLVEMSYLDDFDSEKERFESCLTKIQSLNNSHFNYASDYKNSNIIIKSTNSVFQQNENNWVNIFGELSVNEEHILPELDSANENYRIESEKLNGLHEDIKINNAESKMLDKKIGEKLMEMTEEISLVELRESEIIGRVEAKELQNADEFEPLDSNNHSFSLGE